MFTYKDTHHTAYPNPDNILLVNIETTGLSSRNAFVYMIGLAWMQDGCWQIECCLAKNRMEERTLLEKLNAHTYTFDRIITYGGHSFSYRFLEERWQNYYDEEKPLFGNCHLSDIQKNLSPYKALLPVQDLKKTTIEQFTGFHRHAGQTGRELIDIYAEWERTHAEAKLQSILEHHQDDMQSLIHLLRLSAYLTFWRGNFGDITQRLLNDTQCSFHIALNEAIIRPISYQTKYAEVILNDQDAAIRVPIYMGRLRHFLPGPVRDYYYLPAEDMAIHRSVACYVDKNHRQKATAATCYTSIEGIFLPTDSADIQPRFQESKNSRPYYILYNPKIWQEQPELLRAYLSSIII